MACLCRIIRLNQIKKCANIVRHLATNNVTVNSTLPKIVATNPNLNSWIWQQNDKIISPIVNRIQVDFPNGLKYVPPIEESNENKSLELPTTPNAQISKQAVRMIVVRRNKMKRHKLKKLRKRMKFEWAKRRQRRELIKEKAFQAKLIAQCKEAETFSAEKYVEEKLAKLDEIANELSRIKKARKLKTSKMKM